MGFARGGSRSAGLSGIRTPATTRLGRALHGFPTWVYLSGSWERRLRGSGEYLYAVGIHGREQSLLGFPAGDQVPSPSGSGVYQRFQHGFIISDRRGDFLVMGSEIPSSVEVASGPARPAPPSDEGLRIRIDFEAVQPRSVPAIVYPAGEPVRIDFEGRFAHS